MKAAEAEPGAGNSAPPDDAVASTGISQLISRVLEQLSISSWLPAAMLVANTAVLFQMAAHHNMDLPSALRSLTAKPVGTLVLVLFALVLATLVMQAFEFELIRLVEGYVDPRTAIVAALVRVRIRRHARARDRVVERLRTVTRRALEEAARTAPSDPEITEFLQIITADLLHTPLPAPEPPAARRDQAHSLPWRQYVDSALLYQLDALDSRLGGWPASHRIMPTTLGNTLRSAEDQLTLGQGDSLESFVIRHLDRLPPALRRNHREYRTRLDLYCSLMIVCYLLALTSIVTLAGYGPAWTVSLVAATYIGLACVSYLAAIASARGYGLILREINVRVSGPGSAAVA
jgi:hypothetical protein